MERLGTTWAKELARARRRFLEARTTEDVYYALLSLKNTIHDAHSDLRVPESLNPPNISLYLPFNFTSSHSTNAIDFIVTESAYPEIKKGFVLKKYAGKGARELINDYMEWHRSSSPELLEIEAAEWLTRSDSSGRPLPAKGTIPLIFMDPVSGKEISVESSFQKKNKLNIRTERTSCRQMHFTTDDDYSDTKPVFSGLNYDLYADTASKTLILRYFSFLYDFDDREIWNNAACLSYKPEPVADDGLPLSYWLKRQDAAKLSEFLKSVVGYDRILIDLRENRGGAINEDLLSLMAGKPFKTTYRTMVFTSLFRRDASFRKKIMRGLSPAMENRITEEFKRGAKESSPFAFSCLSGECVEEIHQKAASPALNFKYYLLTGPRCVSSCDQFAAIFTDNGIGTQLGLPTRGASAPFRTPYDFTLANGDHFSITFNSGITYRPNGEPLEGNPPTPGNPVYPRENYLRKILDSL
ncbi:MAG: hypothetical protein A2X28_09465 [Elusimicrobia bacterium GWA2_56_46]|nr:MAG: hypothetical protein A2X28_09465 [Elusimicrobia bacterium GWA2_56_46]OGR55559.1 MAG: hypothetical protein A2X39_08505 [Elusimicrobia bacterium GWC2_56_31]